MVQIIPRSPSQFERVANILETGGQGMADALSNYYRMQGERAKEQRGYQHELGMLGERARLEQQGKQTEFAQKADMLRQQEDNTRKLAKELGLNENINDPKLLQTYAKMSEQRKNEEAKRGLELQEGLQDYQTMKNKFGQEFADLYQASSTGGKTKLMEAAVDSILRDEKNENLFGKQEEAPELEEKSLLTKTGEKISIPNFTKRPQGYTPKEWADERKDWRKENTKSFDSVKDRIKGVERDLLGTKKLQKINESKKLPAGFSKFIINPKSGEIYGLAQLAELASPEAQEWIKEISRFGNRAKDAFGSRVTNFDLYQYMKQFPSLLNTPEGRNRILKMMETNYQLDSLYDKALRKIYDQTGLSGIPPEEADKLTRQMISDETEDLREKYLALDEANIDDFQKEGMSQKRPSLEEIFG